jgi:ribosomal protein S18 acetylase RimI-like enzyme
MIELQPPFRRARPDDAGALVDLVNFASHGLAPHFWNRAAAPGQTGMDVGRERARREDSAFSYRNAIVAEVDGRCAAGLIGYVQPKEPEPIDPKAMPALFVPLQELENLAPGTWYVNVLAAYPEHRGKGYGTRLLAIADSIAAAEGCPGLSIIVSDANVGAHRLYLRNGYREAGIRPMVKEDWPGEGRNWLLLTKDLPR